MRIKGLRKVVGFVKVVKGEPNFPEYYDRPCKKGEARYVSKYSCGHLQRYGYGAWVLEHLKPGHGMSGQCSKCLATLKTRENRRWYVNPGATRSGQMKFGKAHHEGCGALKKTFFTRPITKKQMQEHKVEKCARCAGRK